MSNDIKQEDVKQEVMPEPGSPFVHRRPRPDGHPRYDYDSAMRAARQEMHAENIVELPSSRVGRVIEDGNLIALHDIEFFGKTQFVAYDGYDFVARVQNAAIIGTVLYDLASLHIGQKAQSSHPDDILLVTKVEKMDDFEGQPGGWVVLIRPEVTPGQQNNEQRKRFRY